MLHTSLDLISLLQFGGISDGFSLMQSDAVSTFQQDLRVYGLQSDGKLLQSVCLIHQALFDQWSDSFVDEV